MKEFFDNKMNGFVAWVCLALGIIVAIGLYLHFLGV